jgi:hypothetical protein
MVAKLMDYNCNTFAFIYVLPIYVDEERRLEVDGGIDDGSIYIKP